MTTSRDRSDPQDEQPSATSRLIDEITMEIEEGLNAAEQEEWSAMIAEVFRTARKRLESKRRQSRGPPSKRKAE
jgi:hypothetical protein